MNMAKALAALERMGPKELRAKHLDVFGDPTKTGNRSYLIKRIGWRMQMLAEGDLSQRAKQRAAELARDSDIRMSIPTPSPPATHIGQQVVSGKVRNIGSRMPTPGTLLARQYKGRTVQVTVLPAGFEYEGEVYRSLTAIAKQVTGTHWNGHLFFGLRNGGKS